MVDTPHSRNYNNLRVMFSVSLVAAHIIVVHGEKRSFLELFLEAAYYLALFGSFIMACLIFAFIWFATWYLDKKLPW